MQEGVNGFMRVCGISKQESRSIEYPVTKQMVLDCVFTANQNKRSGSHFVREHILKNLIVLRIATEVRHLAGLTLSNNKGTAVLLRYGDVNQSPAGTAAPNDAKAFLKNQEENGGGGGGITLISTVQIPWIALTSTNATAVVLRLRRRGAGT